MSSRRVPPRAMTGSSPALKPSVSVVVPVYNAAHSLRELALRVDTAVGPTASAYELLLIDDGSEDASATVAAELAERHPWIRRVELTRNYGQHNALLCGIREARYDIIVTIDDDLQNPPEEIPSLLSALNEGHDVVYGYPLRQRHGVGRGLASRVTKFALRYLLGGETALKISSFRAFRRELRRAFSEYQGPSVNVDVLLTWATTRFAAIPVRHALRTSGTSTYGLPKLYRHTLNMVTGFSLSQAHS